MSYAPTEDAAIPINAGIDVRKELSVQRDGKWVLLASPMRIKRGELVRVDLFVSLPTARHFVVVDDPVPGGLEPVNRDLANTSLVDAAAGAFTAAGGSWWFQFGDWRALRRVALELLPSRSAARRRALLLGLLAAGQLPPVVQRSGHRGGRVREHAREGGRNVRP